MATPHSSAHRDGTARRDGRADRGDAHVGDASFRRLVDRSPDGIAVHRDGRVVYANLTAVRWIGAQYADQVRGHPFTEFIHPDSIEPVLTRMAALRNEGDVTRASEGVLVRLDGTTLDVEAVTALTTWEGAPAYHVTLRDMSFNRTAQRSLGFALVCTDETKSHGVERLLRRIVNSLDEGILVIDGSGSVTSANPAAENILGLSAAALVGGDGRAVHAIPMYNADRRPIDLRDHPVTQTVRTGKPFQGFVVGIDRTDGRRTWLRVSCRPLDSDDRYGTAVLVSFSDITAEQVARERLTHRATHDALTGLPNRSAVLDKISDSLRASGDQRLGAVLFIDLDNLKAINDSLGHDSGDELLQSVAHCLRASVGPNDVVGRLGGDEFVTLVAGDIGPAELAAFVGRLEHSLSEPMILGAATVRTQGSIGVTVVAADDPRTAIEILRDADSAMYETKAKRRQRIHRKPGGADHRMPDGAQSHNGAARSGDRPAARSADKRAR
ncbi:MAG: hypothetical protein JWR13_711 [Mycobacterium sp.]|jgi:diguanylate cyclase (GGDEF)-like protein/PAS domain S-box-containing protein|nr:hypothetical protein [Mycobacterium sp.]